MIEITLSEQALETIEYAARIGSSGCERLPELDNLKLSEGQYLGQIEVPDNRDERYTVRVNVYAYQTAGMMREIWKASKWSIRFERQPNEIDNQEQIATGKWLLSKGVITTKEAERDYGYKA